MDFHSLSRKDLQALCKKNRIPANTTNVAMADELTALEMVEGLDEVLNQPMLEPQQSPPRTACRSSRRKPVLAEPFSSQTLTRTRRASRRTTAEETDQETKNEPTEGADPDNVSANLLETPVVPSGIRRGRAVSVRKKTEVPLVESQEEKKNLLETPAVKGSSRRCVDAGSRRNAETKNAEKSAVRLVESQEEKKNLLETPAVKGSSRRCVDAGSRRNAETKNAEKSAVRLYSTRRSVRLLEQTMEVLSLKERENTEVEVKKDACSGMKPEHVDETVSKQVPMEQELGEENKGIESESDGTTEQEEIASKNRDHLAIVSEIEEEDEGMIEKHLDTALDVAHGSIDETKVEEECDANEMHQVQEDESDDKEALVDVSVVEGDDFTIPCLWEAPAPANQVSLFCPSGDAEEQTLSDVYVALAEEFVVAPIHASPMEKLPGGGISRSPFPADTIQGQFPRPPGSTTRQPDVKKQIETEMADDDKENINNSLELEEEPKEEEKVKFDDMSLRQLKKMFKDMSIAKRNTTEEENGIKVENSKRVALQALPDN